MDDALPRAAPPVHAAAVRGHARPVRRPDAVVSIPGAPPRLDRADHAAARSGRAATCRSSAAPTSPPLRGGHRAHGRRRGHLNDGVPASRAPASAAGPRGAAGEAGRPIAPLLEVDELVTHYPVRRSLDRGASRGSRSGAGCTRWTASRFTLAPRRDAGAGGRVGLRQDHAPRRPSCGMVDADSGTVRLNGTDIAGLLGRAQLRPLRRKMQMIYQDPYESLDPRFRVRQTVEEPMLVHGIGEVAAPNGGSWSSRRWSKRAFRPPELYLDRYPHELSGGQRQRVAIAACAGARPGPAARRRAGVDARRLRPRRRADPARRPAPERGTWAS